LSFVDIVLDIDLDAVFILNGLLIDALFAYDKPDEALFDGE
jgi:hypothetical protein